MSVVENGWCIVKNVSFGSQLPSLTPSLFFTTYMRRQGRDDSKSTYLIGFLPRLDELIHLNCLQTYLVHSNLSMEEFVVII